MFCCNISHNNKDLCWYWALSGCSKNSYQWSSNFMIKLNLMKALRPVQIKLVQFLKNVGSFCASALRHPHARRPSVTTKATTIRASPFSATDPRTRWTRRTSFRLRTPPIISDPRKKNFSKCFKYGQNGRAEKKRNGRERK